MTRVDSNSFQGTCHGCPNDCNPFFPPVIAPVLSGTPDTRKYRLFDKARMTSVIVRVVCEHSICSAADASLHVRIKPREDNSGNERWCRYFLVWSVRERERGGGGEQPSRFGVLLHFCNSNGYHRTSE